MRLVWLAIELPSTFCTPEKERAEPGIRACINHNSLGVFDMIEIGLLMKRERYLVPE